MALKRASPESEQSSGGGGREEGDSRGPLNLKRPRLVTFEPVRISSVSSVADLDLHTLRFQNRKLSEKLLGRQRVENHLRSKIEQLEKRQSQDDALLCVVNRYWNRLDEDVRILLQRFDAETAVETESQNEDPATTSFLTLLSQWDKDEIDQNLSQRVEFSKRAIAKLVQAFDRITQRNENISKLLEETNGCGTEVKKEEPNECNVKKEEEDVKDVAMTVNEPPKPLLESEIVEMNNVLIAENKRLQGVVTKLQERNHSLSVEHNGCEDQLAEAETKTEEMENKLEDSYFELEKGLLREEKLDHRLAEVSKELQDCQLQLSQITTTSGSNKDDLAQVSRNKLDELQSCQDEQRELAANRLTELFELKDQHSQALAQLEKLKMDARYTVLYNEAEKIREHADLLRNQLKDTKSAHLKQIEQIEGEELMAQKQLRHEMIQLEEQLSQVRREYEMLRLEFEQNLAANEQSGPVNREMRQLLTSYKTQNQQLKSEAARFKKKWRESISTIAKVQKELDTERKLKENSIIIELDKFNDTSTRDEPECIDLEESEEKYEAEPPPDNESPTEKLNRIVRKYKERCAQLRTQLKEFTSLSKEKRDLAAVLGRQGVLKQENQKLRKEMERVASQDKREKHKFYSDEAMKRIKFLEEQTEKLKKEASSSKTEEDTLLNEMEVTGQAFEEVQEQNSRLLQQLKEKDEANFKLMSERIRSNQQHKKLKEEKDLVEEQVGALQNQVEAQNLVIRKLEEKERILQQSIATLEKELALRVQAVDLNRRKALEHSQSAADLKLQVEKLSAQLLEAQQAVATKTSSLEEESFKIRRLQEEISTMRKRLERSKELEKVDNADEVLLEEIRELKQQLTCPSCKVHPKNAILTKCYHVFCWECLKTRYDTRRRKCPKCNAAFGANDYRRIYIG